MRLVRISDISKFLNEIAQLYLNDQKISKFRYRYENTLKSQWNRMQKLSSNRGLDSIALDEKQEILLKKELDTFVKNKNFYKLIGMPYKRGILLSGKPETGKTSLINAISSYLSRDIYFLNLKLIENDLQLNALFSSVPSNQLIVLEDVDAQSEILLNRDIRLNNKSILDKQKVEKEDSETATFSLPTFLSCLDGHIVSEGTIIIMTTNHINFLDPACIRSGRMDLQLELGYCTHYQIKKMYENIVQNFNITDLI
ncbi:P-loop containing nucleoside triphosphate hydrolase protein [Glomus cerebriforme]|uniref:P-loop containing nucleoside triphosphate hydrolase protein n=1 Tax=Glomus cerebriforme TaxID=658196 RepID=A0A397SGJ0_9GLOM|nr:P-loop containing nucleoside triphosphate hydrolase protein [Glomus cerebriforme]